MIFSKPPSPTDAIERQALAWMRRLATGRMTHAEGEALRRWCGEAPAHRSALAAARRRWELLQAAGEMSAARSPVAPTVRRVAPRRRMLLGGALGFTAAAAAAAAAAVVHPPLGLWPSVDELRADQRTGTGERRSMALEADLGIELNTRTSVALRHGPDGETFGIELIAGELAVDLRGTRLGVLVEAGPGRITASGARFTLRREAQEVCVSCSEGRLEVAHAGGRRVLEAQQQLRYDDRAPGPVRRLSGAEMARLSAWRDGFLRFVDTPLGEVVDEINRYRPGQVVLLNRQLATRQVTGRFQIDALDRAIAQMQGSLGLGVRSLPGGVVLLS